MAECVIYLLLCATLITLTSGSGSPDVELSDEQRLLKDLYDVMKRTNPTGSARPVKDASSTLNVTFGVALVSLVNLDREKEQAELQLWERYNWNDEYLTWDPSEYGGIQSARISMVPEMWRPDVLLYNSMEPDQKYRDDILGVVDNTGSVWYIPPINRKVKCYEDKPGPSARSSYYCTLKYGSWTYDGYMLDLNFIDQMEEIDVSDFIIDNDYTLESHSGRKNVKYYSCCPEPYADVTYSLHFKELPTPTI